MRTVVTPSAPWIDAGLLPVPRRSPSQAISRLLPISTFVARKISALAANDGETWRTTGTPARRARAINAAHSSGSVSNCSSSASLSFNSASSTWTALASLLAPGIVVAVVLPSGCTKIAPRPVFAVTRAMFRIFKPFRERSETAASPKRSFPTAPTNVTRVPSRAAAIASTAPLPPVSNHPPSLHALSPEAVAPAPRK